MSKVAEADLIHRIKHGEKEAYRELVERYQQRVFMLIHEMVRNRADAEDIAQETFVKAYLALPEFKGDSGFFTWLYRIAYNMAIDFKRKVARRGGEMLTLDEAHSSQADWLMGQVESPQSQLTREEQRRQIRAALDSISEEHRVAIVLREIDGLSYAQIAEVTGVSRGTVMSRLHYARKRVQDLIRRWSASEEDGGDGAPRHTESGWMKPGRGVANGGKSDIEYDVSARTLRRAAIT